ncbi:mechanosensitive ion channel family protein [Cyclobacterium jeungdonense]|uniref:Mechanosensitive ion channel n=1 Tax=Cyclobacterium jeungdonense TaxID=708087 RepID=A0ABT8CAN0_9BACT|nr:mechanosensitive ion channel domain-containing protein [Cyclobacterium jeungdonense]MDN3689576.1 mechanosensitive ion channel [Cyclobacterium jeungdonense]
MFDNFLNFDLDTALRNRILQTLLIIFIMWLINKISVRLIYRGDAAELRKQYHWRKVIEYTSFIVGILIIGNLWINNFQSVTTFLGLLSAGIAIALKDIFVNIAGWAFIYLRKPFDVGDRIQIGEVQGDVIDLRLFQFSLLEIGNWVEADQSTGRVVHVPNGKIFMDAQANYSIGFNYIWNEQKIYITLRSDFKRAKAILLEILNEHLKDDLRLAEKVFKKAKQEHLIVYKQFTPMIFTKITERGIQLSMRYLCDPKKRRMFEHSITESILERLGPEDNIRIAYPTSTILLHQDKAHPDTHPGSKRK